MTWTEFDTCEQEFHARKFVFVKKEKRGSNERTGRKKGTERRDCFPREMKRIPDKSWKIGLHLSNVEEGVV